MIVRALSAHLYNNNNNNNNDDNKKKNEKRSQNEKQYHYNRHNNTESINNYSHKITSMKVATSNSLIFRTELRGNFFFVVVSIVICWFFFGGGGVVVISNQYTHSWLCDHCIFPSYTFLFCIYCHVDQTLDLFFFFVVVVSSLSIELNGMPAQAHNVCMCLFAFFFYILVTCNFQLYWLEH